MDATQSAAADPAALIRQLEPDAIRDRIGALDREREALLILLRAATRARVPRRPVRPGGDDVA